MSIRHELASGHGYAAEGYLVVYAYTWIPLSETPMLQSSIDSLHRLRLSDIKLYSFSGPSELEPRCIPTY
jgi:hypothetical protein